MAPAFPSGAFTSSVFGSAVQLKDLNIPLHQNATARIGVIIPRYTKSNFPEGWWGVQPWSKQCYTLLVTTLEEME
jgi:hypothetical protein